MVYPYITIKSVECLLTLGVHAQEGYGTCLVCVCVCLSVCLCVLQRQQRSFLRSK